MPAGTWYPGAVWPGYKVNNVPEVFTQPVTFQGTAATVFGGPATVSGVLTASAGIATTGPAFVVPGTVATLGTVTNSTGYDAMVYASATTGISAAKIGTATIPGSAVAGQTTSYYLTAGNKITLSYTGTLSWTWLAV